MTRVSSSGGACFDVTLAIVSLGYRTDLMLLGLQGSVVEQRPGYQVIRTSSNPTSRFSSSSPRSNPSRPVPPVQYFYSHPR